MAKPVLNASGVVAGVSQGVAAGMPEHVDMDRKGEAAEAAETITAKHGMSNQLVFSATRPAQ
jgi:hypothetical protein